MLKLVIPLVTSFALAIGSVGLASADNRGINFEAPAYHPGSIQGQQGWQGQTPPGFAINPLIDQEVVANGPGAPAAFGRQSWRISNALTSGTFGDMPFSPSLANEAGETLALNGNGPVTFSGGTRQKHFQAQWAFASADPTGTVEKDSYLSISPDRGDGARMSYIRIEDHVTGMRVFFDDYQDAAPFGTLANPAAGCGKEDDFVETPVATNLSRSQAHTIRLTIDFIDGPRNDVVKVYVDGKLRHTGTTWEDYFRWCAESGGGKVNDPVHDQSRTVDSLLFRVGGGVGELHPQNRGKGFLIDNLRYSSSRTAQNCDNQDGEGDTNSDNSTGNNDTTGACDN